MKKPKKHKSPAPIPAKSGGEVSSSSAPSSLSGAASSSRSSGRTRDVFKDPSGEPVAGRAAVPAVLIGCLALMVYFGEMFVVTHGGELDARVHHPFAHVKDLDDLQPKGEEALLKAQGQKVYKLYCSACHQDDGNGNPSAFVPPLAASDWVTPKDSGRIIRIVLNGLGGPVTVNGKQWGQAAMLPWRDSLNDADVAAALTYVRASWGNNAPAVNPDEVKIIREATKDKGGNWTGEELLQIPLKN